MQDVMGGAVNRLVAKITVDVNLGSSIPLYAFASMGVIFVIETRTIVQETRETRGQTGRTPFLIRKNR